MRDLSTSPLRFDPEAAHNLPGIHPGILPAIVGEGAFETVRDYDITTTSGNLASKSIRNVIIPDTGVKPSYTQIRVSFIAGTAILDCLNASVGIRTTDTAATDTEDVPVELLFSGGGGFDLIADGTIISDPLVFSFLNTDSLIVVIDIGDNSKTGANVSGDSDTSGIDNGTTFDSATGSVNDIAETLGVDLVEGFG